MFRAKWTHRIALLGALLMAASPAAGQPNGRHAYVVPFGGYTVFDASSIEGIVSDFTSSPHIGARAGYSFAPWVALELAGDYARTKQTSSTQSGLGFVHGSGDVVLSPYGGRRVSPFLLAGAGIYEMRPGGVLQGHIEAGAGLNYWFSERFGLRFEARNLLNVSGDAVTGDRANTVLAGAGLNFAFGAKSRDTDADGVADNDDLCPDTPAGARVDGNGCTHDGDGDGVVDGLDQCEGTARGAAVSPQGCPSDHDGDRVLDGLDKCPDTPEGVRVDAGGCPHDGDADGVLDGVDQCEGTPRGATVDANGCPADQDQDGVPDGLDKCTDTGPGLRVDVTGCPIEVVERETELMDTGMIRLQNVNFETGRWDILPESLPVLDVVGQVMERWPTLRIEVGGHSDARGAAEYNETLSQRRANAILNYLRLKFPQLQSEQFTAVGYGESKAIATNTTAEGMARNRRVEFVVLNKDALRREVQRRRLLQSGETK